MPVTGNRFFSGSVFEEKYGHSRAVAVGDTIYVAGTTGFDYGTGEMSDDAGEQTLQTLRNIDTALKAFDSSLADVVQIITYWVYDEDWDAIGAALGHALDGIHPVNAGVKTGLIWPEMRVEISATAVRGSALSQT